MNSKFSVFLFLKVLVKYALLCVNEAELFIGFVNYLQKVFVYAVALMRKQSGSTSRGFLLAILEYMFMMAMMMMIMLLLGRFGISIRGPFILYVFTGIAIFMFHNKTIQAFSKTQKSLVPMLAAPESVLIMGELLNNLYMQTIVTIIIFCGIYFFSAREFVIAHPIDAMWIFLLALVWSVSVGMLFYSLSLKWPKAMLKVSQTYRRLGMITSGKMFPGNLAPAAMFAMYKWNPLFHLIDQFRGAIFPTYNPHFTNLGYPMKFSAVLMVASLFLFIWFKRQTGSK